MKCSSVMTNGCVKKLIYSTNTLVFDLDRDNYEQKGLIHKIISIFAF
jgi:hypothetical protein